MKVYICKVWDGDLGDNVVIGAFSSLAKAFEAGGLYIKEESGGTAELLDWDETAPVYIHWYQDHWVLRSLVRSPKPNQTRGQHELTSRRPAHLTEL